MNPTDRHPKSEDDGADEDEIVIERGPAPTEPTFGGIGEDIEVEAPEIDDDENTIIPVTNEVETDTLKRARITIRRKLPGRRLDKYLHGRFRKLSRTIIQRLIKKGDILVNGRPTKNSYEMEGGDVIDISFPPPEPYEVTPEDIPIDIIYEDDFVLAVNKPIGMIVHPASRSQRGTLANALAFHSSSLAKTADPFRPGIVHRLDKNTTGVIIIAKTEEAHWRLAKQFEQRTTEKTYIAVVHGKPEFDEDLIDVPIGQHPTVHDRYVATGFAERMGGRFEKKLSKEAVTRYRVMERYRGFSLVELYPKTGRTHQLRIHMSHIKHPIAGDPFYGGRHISVRDVTGLPDDPETPHWTRQMLHARRLTVMHPIHQKPLTIEAPLAPDMQELVDLLRKSAAAGLVMKPKGK